jgi:hypothetical protein
MSLVDNKTRNFRILVFKFFNKPTAVRINLIFQRLFSLLNINLVNICDIFMSLVIVKNCPYILINTTSRIAYDKILYSVYCIFPVPRVLNHMSVATQDSLVVR